eukprot:TRINITY_DN2822_c0_g1_i1.p1 TRINITY_DN2822_c0_g1~~TRINITY_DN2822_c0_g1_i1.p1  ORF type:complete len:636 (-),score=153.19 TRINITY_DN2822_c0_g1_i1:87-1994(-)
MLARGLFTHGSIRPGSSSEVLRKSCVTRTLVKKNWFSNPSALKPHFSSLTPFSSSSRNSFPFKSLESSQHKRFHSGSKNGHQKQHDSSKIEIVPSLLEDKLRRWILGGCALVLFSIGNLVLIAKEEEGNEERNEEQISEEEEMKLREEEDQKIKRATAEEKRSFKYVIVGGGPASWAALNSILLYDRDAEILVINYDEDKAHIKPYLSKELLLAESQLSTTVPTEAGKQSIFLDGDQDLEEKYPNVTFLSGRKVVDMFLSGKKNKVLLDNGEVILFSKILLASGSEVSTSLSGKKSSSTSERISTYKSLKDFKILKEQVIDKKVEAVAVIGSSPTACELVSTLSQREDMKGSKIIQIFSEDGVLSKMMPAYLSNFLTKQMKKEGGVQIYEGRKVVGVENKGDGIQIKLDNDQELRVNHIVMADYGTPNVEYVRRSGLEVDNINGGIVANAELAAASDVYVAGDVLSFYEGRFNTRRRMESYDHALHSGRVAGKNMTGKKYNYSKNFTPSIWGSINGNTYEGVGVLDSSLKTVSFWSSSPSSTSSQENFKEGVVYYLSGENQNQLVGILCFNLSPSSHIISKSALMDRIKTGSIKSDQELQSLVPLQPVEHWHSVVNFLLHEIEEQKKKEHASDSH